ncbi:MAG: hypothetical protein M4579_005638 [Chaenotheca gracillima]|nr:MAG: hypothetical protein M4579_005638 [Chaenotheca gracillima]
MADFSRFAKPTPEWLEHEKQYGVPSPANVGLVPPEQLQQATNDWREKASCKNMIDEGLHDRVNIQTVEIDSRDGHKIPTRLYSTKIDGPPKNPLPIYVFFHGGGFIYGTLSSEDAACARIAAALPIIVVNVCYRHTPQFKYPKAHEDAFDAFDWVRANARSIGGDLEKIVVGGISAGANLAAALVLSDNRRGKGSDRATSMSGETEAEAEQRLAPIRGQILCIPWMYIRPEAFPYELLESREVYSRQQCANGPVITTEIEAFFRDLMGLPESDSDMATERADDAQLKNSPRTAFVVAGNDPVRDDGLVYAEKLHRNGVPIRVNVFQGLPHGFRRFNDLPSSRRWDELVVEGIRWALEDKPSEISNEFAITVERSDA